MKRNGNLTKVELEQIAEKGDIIHDPDYIAFADLDGTHASKYLESKGFEVVKNYDTGRNGWAITACGIKLSTNGFICKCK